MSTEMTAPARTPGAICILLAVLAAAGSCAPRYVEPRPGGIIVRSDRTGWYLKKVTAKDPPETLLAEDGTICRVAPERFRSTSIGALVRCNWQ